MHVFSDLQAYICTFNDCHERLKTFSTRRLWSQHELEAHFSDKSFRCHDCHESSVEFTDQESFLNHLSCVHGREALTHVHALSMAQAAAQLVPRSFADQKCPLCAQTDWKSQREYFTHVGKHLEKISLVALPQEEDESENDSDHSDEEKYTIKCICGLNDDDGNTVWDERCDTWQHIACYYEGKQIPEEHLCIDCSPRNLDTAGASQRQRRIQRNTQVNLETLSFQGTTSTPDPEPSAKPIHIATSSAQTSSQPKRNTSDPAVSPIASSPTSTSHNAKKHRHSAASTSHYGRYGRHANDWLFSGFSVTESVKSLIHEDGEEK